MEIIPVEYDLSSVINDLVNMIKTKADDKGLELYNNVYPYSNPVLTDDGNILLYLSDNNNPDAPERVVCYAVRDGDGYTEMGRVDTSDDNILADADAVISGTGNQAFAAWVKQMDSPEKEMHDEVTYDDLGMMMNATEIYASVYNGSEWAVQRLTENTDADMSPTIASSGNRAVVAWRSLSATEMPEEGGEQDLTAMFNAQNSINYRVFDGTEWKEAQIALHLLPGQSSVLTVNYLVPETVSDVDYTITADGTGTAIGTLVLNCPDVGIGSMKVTRESDKTRDIRVILGNASDIPLVGSGKTVKLAFYKDSNHQQQIGEVITVDPSAYQDIDDDIYVYNQTLNVEDFIGNALEVPEEGIRIYAQTWVDDTEELYPDNNYSTVTFKGLLSKYQSQIIMDAALVSDENNGYTVTANISNNSLQNAEIGTVVADILDKRNKVLASVRISDGELTLDGEQTQSFSVPVPEFNGEPVQVSLRTTEKSVFLDAQTNGGTIESPTLFLTTDNKPAGTLPEATKNGYAFDGWFTEPTGGEQITEDTVLEGGITIYAQFTYIKKDQNFTIAMDNHDYDGTAPTPTINGTPYGKVTTEYFNADTEELLTEAPSEAGHYMVRVYADGNFYYNDAERTAEYWISTKGMYHVSVKNGTINGENSGEFAPNTIVVVKADEPEAGYKFGYWKRNGMTASYNKTYTFPITSENIELEAVYVEDTDDIERYGNAVIDSVTPDKTNNKIQFVSMVNVPEDCTILKAGIVATSDGTKAETLTDENAEYVRYNENLTVHNYKYTWTKSNINDDTWYVRGYLVYEDADGNQKTVYSDLAKATLDGYETIREDKILGTAVMDSVAVDKENNKIAFAAFLNVPADCTISKAGIVATSDAEKVGNLTAENADYVRADATTKHSYKYTWTKTNVTETQTWYVRPYLVYTDANGKEFTVYGELTSAGLSNSSDTTQSNVLSQRLLLAAQIGAGIKLS